MMSSLAGGNAILPQKDQISRDRWNFLSLFVVVIFLLAMQLLCPALAGTPPPPGDGPLMSKAKSAEAEGNFEGAVQQYRAVLKQSPSSMDARLGLGRSLANLADCEEADKVLGGIAGSNTQRAEAETIVGNCYYRTHNYEPAISHLHEATLLNPKGREASITLSHCYAETGRRTKAVEILKKWLARNGDDAEVLFWVGNYYDDLAANTFQQMAEKHPNSYLVYMSRGEQYLEKKDTDRALKALDEAVALAPNAPGVHYTLGHLYWRLRDLDKAKQELEIELRSNPYHAMANFLMGDIYVTLRDPKKATPYLERAIALNPTIWDAHRSLGRALVMENRLPEAIQQFQIVADANPRDDTIHGLLSNAYRRMGNMEKAQEEGQIFLKLSRQRSARVPKPTIEDAGSPDSQ